MVPTTTPMVTETRSTLGSLADWIRATDDHAEEMLRLVGEAESALAEPASMAASDRVRLADRLERWRYRRLAQGAGDLAPLDRQLVDALDLAANALAGRPGRAPRSARTAVADPAFLRHLTGEAAACLDPKTDLAAIAQRAAALTRERFGVSGGRAPTARWRMLLYAPLYVSNYCVNHCLYCGFRHPHPIPRKHLTVAEAVREAEVLLGRGFRHILVVAGDFPRWTTPEYLAEILRELRARGATPSVEIAPQSTSAYASLVEAGARGLTLYQETYDPGLYALYHPRGTKAFYDWRLEGPERAAEAGMPRLGLGILLGLADPREDLLAMIRHAGYLRSRFPDRTLAFSLPRIHDAPPGFRVAWPVDDDAFTRMYCALRIAFPDAHLVLSTREPAPLRNRLAEICITQMSAGSCTAPGGYDRARHDDRAGEQFPVCDHRSPAEVASWLAAAGFEPAWQ